MWQKFTEEGRRSIFYAQEEAAKCGDNNVSTEHLLAGMLREENSGTVTLKNMGISLQAIQEELSQKMQKKGAIVSQDMQLTPRAKKIIDLAYDESRGLNNDYIGTEHLLLGLVREAGGVAGQVLRKAGVEIQALRAAVIEFQQSKTFGAQEQHTTADREYHAPPTISALYGKDLLDIASLTRNDLDAIFEMTRKLKNNVIEPDRQRKILNGMTMAMIFEKPSLRTRVSFETGIFQLGGHGIYLAPADISLGKRESIADAARTLDRMADIIMARVFAHSTVTELAEASSVPVINGLSDLEHPCQALADFYTILEKKERFEGLKLAFIGDGNNVAHSLMLLAAKVGTHFSIGCPEGYEPDPGVVEKTKLFAKETGAQVEIVHDAAKAADGADVIYTDVWASMGQEDEAAEREKAFAAFQVNAQLMKHAKDDAIFEHCLPAHRGSEVTDEVIDSPQSVVFDEAENRLHAQKAVMALLAG